MRRFKRHVVVGVVCLGAALALSARSFAQDLQSPSQSGLAELRALIELQRQQIEAQRREMAAQRQRIEALETATSNLKTITLDLTVPSTEPAYSPPRVFGAGQYRPGGESYYYSGGAIQPALYDVAPQDRRYAQAEPGKTPAEERPAPVGEPPSPPKPTVELAGVREVGGVLTRKGVVIVESQFQYSQSNINRFFFQGVEIVETVLIGVIEATDSDRDTLIAATAVRYGVTDRLEVEARVPFVYRDDRVIRRVVSTQEETRGQLDAFSVGDIEASARYQINRGLADWPIFVANLRIKSNTGVGPFDVDRDEDGVETELPTGSGFWAVQPGITALVPSDPVVFFANVNYLWHFAKDVDEQIGESVIGDVDPGDVIGFSMGMALALNERTSFSVGYEHNFILKTTTEIDGVDVDSETLDVGLLRFGFGYRLNERVGLHLNLGVGVTEDAPDVTLTLRTPFRF